MKSLAELKALRDKMKDQMGVRTDEPNNIRIVVGMGTCGIATGAREVLSAIAEEVSSRNLQGVTVAHTGCPDVCQYEPVVEVFVPGKDKVTYVKMNPEMAKKVVAEHIAGGNIVAEYTIGNLK